MDHRRTPRRLEDAIAGSARARVLVVAIAAILCAALDAQASPAWTWLDPANPSETWIPHGLSSDGGTVVGQLVDSGGVGRAARWTSATGIEALAGIPLPEGPLSSEGSTAFSVSADGGVIVGGTGGEAFVYEAGSTTLLPALTPGGAGARVVGVSDDGTQFVGLAHDGSMQNDPVTGLPTANPRFVVVQWFPAFGNQPFELMPFHAVGADVANDGSLVANLVDGMPSGDVQGIRYATADNFFSFLPGFEADEAAELAQTAPALSADGRTIVASGLREEPGSGRRLRTGFRWRGEIRRHILSDEGVEALTARGDPAWLGTHIDPLDLSPDGETIVGRLEVDDTGERRAFVWTEASGLQDLNVLLASLGLDLDGWTLVEASAVAADGRTFLGLAARDGMERSFLVVVPEPGTVLLLGLGLAGLGRFRRSR